jgi:hypothetical protein
VVVVFGARRHAPHLTASWFAEDGDLEEFAPDEELDPTALPFLHPLQHAVDALPAIGEGFDAMDPSAPGAAAYPSSPDEAPPAPSSSATIARAAATGSSARVIGRPTTSRSAPSATAPAGVATRAWSSTDAPAGRTPG